MLQDNRSFAHFIPTRVRRHSSYQTPVRPTLFLPLIEVSLSFSTACDALSLFHGPRPNGERESCAKRHSCISAIDSRSQCYVYTYSASKSDAVHMRSCSIKLLTDRRRPTLLPSTPCMPWLLLRVFGIYWSSLAGKVPFSLWSSHLVDQPIGHNDR